jgi:N6-L-threonylcarbamoyladenine synthase
MLVLGIESSCDETGAAILADGNLLADVVNSQVTIHGRYGGVVPELASRQHLENIYPVIEEALSRAAVTLDQIDAIAVTNGPGLIGCLLVGLSFAKALAYVKKIPLVGVDHIAGHLLSVFLGPDHPTFPYVAVVVSGGHSSIFLVNDYQTFKLMGRTRDDAAGEAFDKVAKLLELGYPGGPIISRLATQGNPKAINFPRSWLDKDSLDFSFSGLKTAVATYVRQQRQQNTPLAIPDICASFQEAVVEVLADKAVQAARQTRIENIVLAGGVAANPRLRECLLKKGAEEQLKIFLPPLEFCTDNAAMIALAGYHLLPQNPTPASFDMDAYSRSQFELFAS